MSNVTTLKQPQARACARAESYSQQFNELTEVFAAQEFVKTFEGELVYCPQLGQWLEFDKDAGGWVTDESRKVVQKAIEVAKNMLSEAGIQLVQASKIRDQFSREAAQKKAVALSNFSIKTQSKAKLESMTGLASTFPKMVVHQNQLDQDEYKFGVENGESVYFATTPQV